jgi:predicted phosphodiesterase
MCLPVDELNIGDALKNFRAENANKDALGVIKDLLDRNNIDLDEVGKISRVSLYQTAAKDADGEIQTKDLVGIQISPKWEQGPEWPVVQPAQPVVIKSPAKPKKAPALIGGWKQAVILPDPQIGFRQFDEDLDPFHDDKAMDVALQVLNSLEHDHGVDQVINLGDFLDLPAQGKYEQEAAFAFTTQHAIDRGHLFLGQQRSAAPDAKIVVLEGNHDRRMQKFVQANALSAFGLRRANVPDSWPVMSLPYLLRLDELDIEYIDAYPAGMWWINDSLRAIHGDKVNSGGSTAMKYTNEMPHISTVFGHIHRQEIQSKTTFDRAGKIKAMAISPGCLCRVDGAVPSVKGSVGIDGRPVTYYENWQQGMAVITYKPEGSFHVDLVHIDDGKTLYRGQEFSASL